MLSNSRCIIVNTTGKSGLFRGSQNNLSLIKLRKLSITQCLSNNNTSDTTTKQSAAPKKSSSGFKIVALALTGFTVGLGFATLNPDSRRHIQGVIPQSKDFFDKIDDLLNKKKPKKSIESIEVKTEAKKDVPEPEKPKEVVPESVPIIQTIIEEPVQKQELETPKQESILNVDAPVVSLQEKAPVEPALDLDWKKTLKRHELQQEATIDAIETKLTSHILALKAKVEELVLSTNSSLESLKQYSQALRNALDENQIVENKEQQWKEVTDLFYIQSFNVNETNQKFEAANKSAQELESLIKQLKSSELNENIKNLRESQFDLIEQCRKLQSEKSQLSEAIIHANVLRTYTNEQKLARNQFLKEMQALQPEGIQVNRAEDQLTTEEINNLLIHAHKRVIQLQKQIEKIQTQQSQQIQAALEEQRNQNAQLQKENEANLYDICQKEFALEKEKIIEAEKQKALEEIKKELSRQAAAHNNHLAKMLKIQEDELNDFYEKKLTFENEKIRREFYSKVAESLGRIKGLENAINARANLELQSNNAKQLWLAVQSLSQTLSSSIVDSSNQEIASIKSSVDKIKQSAPENDFIKKIIDSIPTNALEIGVWTEPDLKERFYRLKTLCSRVALIDERGGSLFKYFISYLQSFFIMHAKIDAHENLPVSLNEINLNSTFSILDHAQYYIENGNIESAIRLMQQLKGEPYMLARDWIKEAILLLEIKQACQLLTAYISSVYISTNFK